MDTIQQVIDFLEYNDGSGIFNFLNSFTDEEIKHIATVMYAGREIFEDGEGDPDEIYDFMEEYIICDEREVLLTQIGGKMLRLKQYLETYVEAKRNE